MKHVNNEKRTQWGNQFKDRKDSFDDKNDIEYFIWYTKRYKSLYNYLCQYLPKEYDLHWSKHPNGKYGVDLALACEHNIIRATFDLERWSQWGENWPRHYKYISFLERKAKYINTGVPFFMVYLNEDWSKVLIVDAKTLYRYAPVTKNFQKHKVKDTVRTIPLSEGHMFGDDLTDFEYKNFKHGLITL